MSSSFVAYRSAMSKILSTMEILETIFDHSDLETIVSVGQTSKYAAGKVLWYLRRRLHLLSKESFDGGDELTYILQACDAVVSRSAALHISDHS